MCTQTSFLSKIYKIQEKTLHSQVKKQSKMRHKQLTEMSIARSYTESKEHDLLFISNFGGTFHFPVNKDLIQKKKKSKALFTQVFCRVYLKNMKQKTVLLCDLLNLSLHSTCNQLCMLEGKETANKRAANCNARLNSACLLRKKNINAMSGWSSGLGVVLSHVRVRGQS